MAQQRKRMLSEDLSLDLQHPWRCVLYNPGMGKPRQVDPRGSLASQRTQNGDLAGSRFRTPPLKKKKGEEDSKCQHLVSTCACEYTSTHAPPNTPITATENRAGYKTVGKVLVKDLSWVPRTHVKIAIF